MTDFTDKFDTSPKRQNQRESNEIASNRSSEEIKENYTKETPPQKLREVYLEMIMKQQGLSVNESLLMVDQRIQQANEDQQSMDELIGELNEYENKKNKLEKFVDTVTDKPRTGNALDDSILNQSNYNMVAKYDNKGLDNSMAAGLGTSMMKSVQSSIARQSSFKMAYGDVMRSAVAFVMENEDDQEDQLLTRLNTIDQNLDMEMENINRMIATMDPRQSTRYAKLAEGLRNELCKSINNTAGFGELQFQPGKREDQAHSDTGQPLAASFSGEVRPRGNSVDQFDSADTVNSSDMFHQIKVATAKDDNSQIFIWKENIIKSYKKLTSLRADLTAYIDKIDQSRDKGTLKGSLLGKSRTVKGSKRFTNISDPMSGKPNYTSGNLSTLGLGDQGMQSSAVEQTNNEIGDDISDGEWLANLIFKINYQLEKLRYILEGKVYPRDEQLMLFDTNTDFDQETKDGLTIKKLDHDCNLLLAQKITSELYERIQMKLTNNAQIALKRQLESEIKISNKVYLSFRLVLGDPNQIKQEEYEIKQQIMGQKAKLLRLIKKNELKPYMIKDDKFNRHLFRIIPKPIQGKSTVQELLSQEVCFYFRISDMNWGLLDKKKDWYHEITLQIYHTSGKALTKRTIVPLDQGLENGNNPVSWIFQQIPLLALLTLDLALVIKVYQIRKDPKVDVLGHQLFRQRKPWEEVKMLDGWSIINISATYALTNGLEGQLIGIDKLQMFSSTHDLKFKIHKEYQQQSPASLKLYESPLLTQKMSINAQVAFAVDTERLQKKLRLDRSIWVDQHTMIQSGLFSKNETTQKRIIKHIETSRHVLKINIDGLSELATLRNNLVKVEVALTDRRGQVIRNSFFKTDCSEQSLSDSFESETFELTNRVGIRSYKFCNIPIKKTPTELKSYNLLFMVKVAQGDPSISDQTVFDQFRGDPESYVFKTVYITYLPLYDGSKNQPTSDGQKQIQLYTFDLAKYKLASHLKDFYKQWPFKKAEFSSTKNGSPKLIVELSMNSTLISKSARLNFLMRLDQPERLTLENMKVLHQKLRELEAQEPMLLLVHYKPILNSLVKILSLDHDLRTEQVLTQIERRLSIQQMEQNEERTDIVFQMLLLMIDVFYQTYPDYSKLFEDYIEEEFTCSKVFFALTKQVTQIGQAFEEDFKDLDRTWLVQTLSYFHLILKMLRISFINNVKIEEKKEEEEKAKQEQLEALKHGSFTGSRMGTNSIILEQESEISESDYHSSAHFGENEIPMTYQGDNPFDQFGAKEKAIPRLPEIVEDINETKISQSTNTLQLSPPNSKHLGVSQSQQSIDMTAIYTSSHDTRESGVINETEGSGEVQIIEHNLKVEQDKLNQRQSQLISSQEKSDTAGINIKKIIRSTVRRNDQILTLGHKGRISCLLKHSLEHDAQQQVEPITEEDIILQVSEAVLLIFAGCYSDSRKVTMYLRQILLENFLGILEEVSLICGEQTANHLLLHLYDEKSLDEQYKLTDQVIERITDYEKRKKVDVSGFGSNDIDEKSAAFLAQSSKSSMMSKQGVAKWFHEQGMTYITGYVQEDNFPFGEDISSFITETQLNQLRVIAMGKILYRRTMQKIPNNPKPAIEKHIIEFCTYVNKFGNVKFRSKHGLFQKSSTDILSLRALVFFFLHQLLFYINKEEDLRIKNTLASHLKEQKNFQKGRRVGGLGTEIGSMIHKGLGTKTITMASSIQTQGEYLNVAITQFISLLPQLAQDVLMFSEDKSQVDNLLSNIPYLKESMKPFTDQCALVVLSLVDIATKPYIRKHFFNRPSLLAKLLDTFEQLEEKIEFEAPYNSYFDKKRLEITARFNQNVSELIQDQFRIELPELYIPVINKLVFRYFSLFITANEMELSEKEQQKQRLKFGDTILIDKEKLVQQMWKLITKSNFKEKCLMYLLVIKIRQDDEETFDRGSESGGFGGQTREASYEHNNQAEVMKKISKLYHRVNTQYERYKDLSGLKLIFRMVTETALVELCTTGSIHGTHKIIFLFFIQVKFLKQTWDQVQLYINLLRNEVKSICEEEGRTTYLFDKDQFSQAVTDVIDLVAKIYFTQFKYHKQKQLYGNNPLARTKYGLKLITLLTKAKLYTELQTFINTEFGSVMTKLKWNLERTFLDLHSYELLKRLTDDGTMYLGNTTISTNLHAQQLMDVADKFKEARFYDKAVEILDKTKEHYQKVYDFDAISIPMQKQVAIYKQMSNDKRQEHATYFSLHFVGVGHIEQFRDKKFIYRAKANKTIFSMEEKLQKRFDQNLSFIEDDWPTEEELASGKQYCRMMKVKPFTYKEVLNFQLMGLEDEQLSFDSRERNLQQRIKNMPHRMQTFHIQNYTNKFYSQQAKRIVGVDSVLFDQEIQVFAVKEKFPCMTAIQKVVVEKKQTVSCVRQAVKEIQDTDHALMLAKNNVISQAFDEWNVELLHTALRKTLIADINGGFKRYIQSFFTNESCAIEGRKELLYQLYAAIHTHFENVRSSIHTYSLHNTTDSATAQFYSNLSQLERLLLNAEKQLNIKQQFDNAKRQAEHMQVQEAVTDQQLITGLTGHDSLTQVSNTLKQDESQMNKESYKINYLRLKRPSFSKEERPPAQRNLRNDQKAKTKLVGIQEEGVSEDESIDYGNSYAEFEGK